VNATPAPAEPSFSAGARGIFLAGALIAAAVLAAYANSFSGPFVFDDEGSITENASIRQLWPPWPALSPPHAGAEGGLTVSGRPVLNLSFALNHAVSGEQVWSYHALNLAIHLGAALLLFGVVRRTLRRPLWRERFARDATPLAALIALLWAVHPLQTESVTYVVQRAESLMGFFFLLTLYAFVRGVESVATGRWQIAAVIACAVGMATKEVMVSAPLIVLLYDRTFCAGSFSAAWRQRRGLYGAMAATWLLLGWLVLHTGDRGGSAGYGVDVAWWTYALTQSWAIVRYLALSVCPCGLVFDYGTPLVTSCAAVAPQLTLVALWRRPALGFLGAWFFAILAPTSSVVAVATQTVAEHRMYLPLAAIATLAGVGLHALPKRAGWWVGAAVAVVLAALTVQRNADYRTGLRLWEDTVAKRPDNARARNNLGRAQLLAGEIPSAIDSLTTALRLKPDYAAAHSNLGTALTQAGRATDAVAEFEQALRVKPDDASIHHNFGGALLRLGRFDDAQAHFARAATAQPELAAAQENDFGGALLQHDRAAEAISHLGRALQLRPDFAEAHNNLGNALAQLGRTAEALPHYEAALRVRPDDALAHYNLGNARFALRRFGDAADSYAAALRWKPAFAEADNNLGSALEQLGRTAEARAHYESALRAQPDFAAARKNLDRLDAAGPTSMRQP